VNFYQTLRKTPGLSVSEKVARVAARLRSLEASWNQAFGSRRPRWDELLEWIERVEFDIADSPRNLASRAKRRWRFSTTIPLVEQGGTMLDVGCGLGTDSILLHLAKGVQVTGIDMDQGSLETGAVRVGWLSERLGLQRDAIATPRKMNAANLAFHDAQFDIVWSNESIEHIHPTDALFKEVHRVLKPGGRFFVINQNGLSVYERLKAFKTRGFDVYAHDTDPLTGERILIAEERLLTPRACCRLLERLGFGDAHVMLNGVLPSPIATLLGSADRFARLDRLACALPLVRSQASDFVLVATKQ
jgi:ubiquinone/menaquinone biosynthesis C-methylase UbiE